jgi:membrane protein required for colicin V production
MNVATYDLVMLGVLLAATALGAWKGLAWQVASLAAILASYVVAYRYRESVAAWIPVQAPWRVFLAMLLLYLGSSLAIWIAFRLVSRLIDRGKLKDFDRQVGALLGFAKGVVLCVLITLFAITLLGEKQRAAIVNSQSGYYISVLLNRADLVMPDEIHAVLQPYLRVLDEQLKERSEQGGATGRRSSRVALRRYVAGVSPACFRSVRRGPERSRSGRAQSPVPFPGVGGAGGTKLQIPRENRGLNRT